MRVLILIAAFVACFAAGALLGFASWGRDAKRAAELEDQLQKAEMELTHLASERAELEHRMKQVSAEQERLFRQNEELRRQRATHRVTQEAAPPP